MNAAIRATNSKSLFIGEITSEEADSLREDNPEIDGFGFYLLSVDRNNPGKCGDVLAKFTSEAAARAALNIFRLNGLVEA